MSYRVLVVDDSSIVRKVMAKTLGLTGLPIDQIFEAGNGREAIDSLKQNWVDLVFLDINMPVMNGVEFMEHVRADDTLKHTPVVVVSTEGSKERKDRLKALGVSEYLRKPVTPEALCAVVNTVLGGKQP
jgi:two-component system chemotaxis response regulator CheY